MSTDRLNLIELDGGLTGREKTRNNKGMSDITYDEVRDREKNWSRYFGKKGWLVVGILVIPLLGWLFSPMEVTVTGEGEVIVPAEEVSFSVSVSGSGASGSEALTAMNTKLETVKKLLSEMNVTAEKLSETQIAITPEAALTVGGSGYQALVTVNAQVPNVREIPDAIVSLYGAGASVVTQPVVVMENTDALEKEAMNKALADAKGNLRNTVGWRPFVRMIGLAQATSGNTASLSKKGEGESGYNGEFEMTQIVSVTYRVW